MAGASPFTDAGFVPGELFQAIAGTSMSSPVTAGIYALIKQAHPDWTPAMAKSALMGTADTDVLDNDRVSQAGPVRDGCRDGEPRQGRRAEDPPFNPGLVYDAGFNDYFGFLCDAAPEIPSVTPRATCGSPCRSRHPHDRAEPQLPVDRHRPSWPASRRSPERSPASLTTGPRSTPDVNAPKGYTVPSTPGHLAQAPVRSASFDRDDHQRRRSARRMAVRRSHLEGCRLPRSQPDRRQGCCAERAGRNHRHRHRWLDEFDVKFGYTGAYTAAARHGAGDSQ